MSHADLFWEPQILHVYSSWQSFCIVPSSNIFLKPLRWMYRFLKYPILFAPEQIQNCRINVKNKSTFEKMWGPSPLQPYTYKEETSMHSARLWKLESPAGNFINLIG